MVTRDFSHGNARRCGTMNWFQRLFCGHSIKGICRHSATYAAIVYGERHPVRICGGQIGDYAHTQAQALIDGGWEWLQVSFPTVYVGGKDSGFEPNIIIEMSDWLRHPQLLAENQPKLRQ